MEHPANTSPIRKALAKKMINYYDKLQHIKHEERSKSPSKDRIRQSSRERLSGSKMEALRASNEWKPDQEAYEDAEHRRVKLAKLKSLMKTELNKANVDHALDPNFDLLKSNIGGAPSFINQGIDIDAFGNLFLCQPLLLITSEATSM